MKIAIVSDIHGNIHALKAVEKRLAELNVENVWCLGDTVGYGAFPDQCVEWVRENCSVVLLGNHELALLGFVDPFLLNDYARWAIDWTKKVISPDKLEFLRELGVQYFTECCQLVHDTPESPGSMDYVLTKEDAYRALLSQQRDVCFFGHTHIPAAYRLLSSTVDRLSVYSLSICAGRYLINPGSVGQPRDNDPRASFGIFDPEENRFSLYRVEYDTKAAAREILRAGLPEYLAARLILGV